MKTLNRAPKPHKILLDSEVFSEHLSTLGVCETGEYAYLKLDLESLSLESICGIEKFPHLQHVNLAKNKLTSLKPLSSLKHLLTLNVSENQLSSLQTLPSPANLLYINLSSNQLKSIGNLSTNQYLQRLNLNNNLISEISGIEQLPNLQYLSLSSNKIVRVSGIPASLHSLDLSKNEIRKIGTGFSKLSLLKILDLSYNKISSLKGTEDLESLMMLNLKGNLMRKIITLDHVAGLALLSEIDLSENLVCGKDHYRLRIAYKLPQLRKLDSENVTAEEKIKAENLYGLDIEDRKALFAQIFPGQIFIDRRLNTSEMIDVESESDDESSVVPQKMSATGSKAGSRTLSKAESRGSVGMEDVLVYSKRYVGELIEKEDT